MSLYRSELARIVRGLIEVHKIGAKSVMLCCDNDRALVLYQKPVSYKNADLDLHLALVELQKGIKIMVQYVEGHADHHKLAENLTYWERQNQTADQLATMTLEPHLSGNEIQALTIPRVLGHFIINDRILTTVDRKSLHQQLAENQQCERVCQMFDLLKEQYATIQWDRIHRTQQQNCKSLVQWLFKISNKSAPTRRRHFVRQEIDNDCCLFCNESDTLFHCLTCPVHTAAWNFHWVEMIQQVGRIVEQPVVLHRIFCRLLYGGACCTK